MAQASKNFAAQFATSKLPFVLAILRREVLWAVTLIDVSKSLIRKILSVHLIYVQSRSFNTVI